MGMVVLTIGAVVVTGIALEVGTELAGTTTADERAEGRARLLYGCHVRFKSNRTRSDTHLYASSASRTNAAGTLIILGWAREEREGLNGLLNDNFDLPSAASHMQKTVASRFRDGGERLPLMATNPGTVPKDDRASHSF
jgi:hypothetical protein